MGSWRSQDLIHIIPFIFLFLCEKVCCELRFCHKGPHKVSGNQCPNGIVFKTPINTKCLYYIQEFDDTSKSPSYSQGPCVTDADAMSIKDKTKMESVQFQRLDYNEDGRILKPAFNFKDDLTCVQECLSDVNPWLLTKNDEELTEYSFIGTSNCSDQVNQVQNSISFQLFDHLFFGQKSAAKLPSNRLFDLLDQIVLIGAKYCGDPYVKSDFLVQAHEALKFLHFGLNREGIVTDVSVQHGEDVGIRLTKCLDSPNLTMILDGTKCAAKSKIDWIEIMDSNMEERHKYRLYPKSYRFGKLDIFIEALWTIIDFASSYCYDLFIGKYVAFDHFIHHLANIFKLESIQQRWMCPPKLKYDAFWNNLAGVMDIKWTMRNLDFCAQAAGKSSVFGSRLDRAFETPGDRDEASLLDNGGQSSSGWQDSEESYWKAYETMGGIQNILKLTNEGSCIGRGKDIRDYLDHQHISCPSSNDPDILNPQFIS